MLHHVIAGWLVLVAYHVSAGWGLLHVSAGLALLHVRECWGLMHVSAGLLHVSVEPVGWGLSDPRVAACRM